MTDLVRVERDDRLLLLTLNRPERRNALTQPMYGALADALAEAREDSVVRVVLISGEGAGFCAGNDMMDFIQAPPTSDDSAVLRFMRELASFPKPVVVAVHGAAIGIGTTMLLHADLAYASEDASFKMPFVQLGLVPEFAATVRVPNLVGHRRATELLVLGERFDAATAERLGFVNAVVPDVLATARAAAERLAALPPEAVRASKALLRAPEAEAIDVAMKAEVDAFAERLKSPELVEAVTAFMEKRPADFSQF